MPNRELIVHSDGACRGNPGPAATGWVIFDDQGQVLQEGGTYLGHSTNNVTEYRAAIEALEQARLLGARRVRLKVDSELLACQVDGRYRVRHSHLKPLLQELHTALAHFEQAQVENVPREANSRADRLANQVLDCSLSHED